MAVKGNSRPPPADADDSMDRLSCNTLKRHPKMDLNKADMLQLLSYLEGELQARDVAIAALQAEKAKQFLYQAKYGRFGLVDPLHALQRDSELVNDTSFDEAAVKAMYDDQLMQLENLIATQHRSQQQMREQLSAVEKRYHRTCVELDEEKQKHARDMEQGDNVTYMLEKDRERLKQELELERSQAKKMEKELKKTSNNLDEDRVASAKHKQVAVMLIKQRAQLVQKLLEARERSTALSAALSVEQESRRELEERVVCEARGAEADFERRLHEADFEREQLRARLAKAETHNRELCAELDRLRGAGGGAGGGDGGPQGDRKRLTESGVAPARHPHVYISERTVSPTPVTTTVTHSKILLSAVPQAIGGGQVKSYGPTAPGSSPTSDPRGGPKGSAGGALSPRKNSPESEQGGIAPRLTGGSSGRPRTPALSAAQEPVSAPSGAAPMRTLPQANVTVGGGAIMTTDTGARISINVGPSTGPQRKLSPLGRGCPPPIPPNKPQVFIPMATPPSVRPTGAQDGAGGLSRLQPSSKPGAAVAKDRMSSAATEWIGSTVETSQQHSMPSVRSTAAPPLSATAATGTAAAHTNTSLHALSELSAERKPSPQLCVNIK